MTERGFTLVELLVASVIALFVAGAALLLADAARTALAVEPAASDTARRLREGVAAVEAAVRSAGGELGIGMERGSLTQRFPVVRLLGDTGVDAFNSLVITRAVHSGRGHLVSDQPGPGGSLTLSTADGLCPGVGTLCGFRDGDVAAVFDGRGHADVFVVGSVDTLLARLTPRAPLAHAYRTGAWVVEVRQERFALLLQPDGSQTLTRYTAAGAREPLVDGVTRFELRAWGRAAPPGLYRADADRFAQYGLLPPREGEPDPEGIFAAGSHCMSTETAGVLQSTINRAGDPAELSPLLPGELEDGPWCPHDDAEPRFDADWFRVSRIDVMLQVEVSAAERRGAVGRLFTRPGTSNNAPGWVRDRAAYTSVAVGQ